jgi:type I restriction enzyme S subunit
MSPQPQSKPYPAYKPSGVDWLGDVPAHWEVSKIKFNTYVKARVGWHGLNSNRVLKK